MKVGPSDTYVDPRTGKTVYQGPWAGSGGMLNGPALDQAAEAYYQTGKPPPNLGRGIQGAAGLNAVITRAAELHPDDPVEDWPERQAKFKAEKGFTGQVDDLAAGIKKGDQPPTLTGLYGLSGPIRQKLEKDGFDLAGAQLQWQRAQKQIASLNGPQQVRFVGLANSVVNTIDEVRDLSEQMGNSGVPLLNKAKMEAYAQANGNSDKGQLTARYIAAVNTLKEEFANLANGGYAPTGGGLGAGQWSDQRRLRRQATRRLARRGSKTDQLSAQSHAGPFDKWSRRAEHLSAAARRR